MRRQALPIYLPAQPGRPGRSAPGSLIPAAPTMTISAPPWRSPAGPPWWARPTSTPRGTAYVYARSRNSWHRQAVLAHRGAAKDEFGLSVAVTITRPAATAVVGAARGRNGTGAAYIFAHRPSGSWHRQARLAGPSPAVGDEFGLSVAIADARCLSAPQPKGSIAAEAPTSSCHRQPRGASERG